MSDVQPHELDMDRISRCGLYLGWHVDMAGPCFDTHAQAVAWRDRTEDQRRFDSIPAAVLAVAEREEPGDE